MKILYKKGPPVFNDPIWHLKGQYAMILLPIGTKKMKEGYFDERRYETDFRPYG